MFTVRERGEIPEPTKIIILNYLRNLAHLGCESSQTLNLISFLFFPLNFDHSMNKERNENNQN